MKNLGKYPVHTSTGYTQYTMKNLKNLGKNPYFGEIGKTSVIQNCTSNSWT